MNRRSFLTGLTGLLVAPAIVRATSIMPVSVAALVDPIAKPGLYWTNSTPLDSSYVATRIREVVEGEAVRLGPEWRMVKSAVPIRQANGLSIWQVPVMPDADRQSSIVMTSVMTSKDLDHHAVLVAAYPIKA